ARPPIDMRSPRALPCHPSAQLAICQHGRRSTMTATSHMAHGHLIGVLGATHGDLSHLLKVLDTLWQRGVGAVLVLGDFGFIWPRETGAVDLDALSVQLTAHQQTLFFVDGNHEDFNTLATFPITDDGLRWVRSNVAHLPRGYRTVLES